MTPRKIRTLRWKKLEGLNYWHGTYYGKILGVVFLVATKNGHKFRPEVVKEFRESGNLWRTLEPPYQTLAEAQAACLAALQGDSRGK